MSDQDELNRVYWRLLRIEDQIKDLNETEWRATRNLCQELDLTADLPRQLNVVRAAENNLKELRQMAWKLDEAYVENAQNLCYEAEVSDSLKATDTWLAVCYFVVAVGKVMDAIAQFWGGPYAKLITSLKTPITDIGKEITTAKVDPKRGQPDFGPLAPAQFVNLSMMAGNAIPEMDGMPGYSDLAALQKGLGAIIEAIKDLAGLYKNYKAGKAIMGDTKKLLLTIGDTAKTLIDLVNRLITLYETQGQLRRGKSVWSDKVMEKKVGSVKDYLSAAKYLIEAVLNFAQFGLSVCDRSDDMKASHDAVALANRQLASTGGGAFNTRTELFAQATRSDLINIIHSANSHRDALEMARLCTTTLRELPGEIERLKGRLERRHHLWSLYRQESNQKKLQMQETQKQLPELRHALEKISDKAEFRYSDGTWRTRTFLAHKIDELDGAIERILKPVPRWIPPKSRFGPRVSPV
jgi:hypothetical protein